MQSKNSHFNQRQLRVGEMIKHALASIFIRGDIFDPTIGEISITISEVKMNANLRLATVYFVPFNTNIEKEILMKTLKSNIFNIRNILAKEITIRYLPELIFKFDHLFEQYNRINKLISDSDS